MSKFLHIFQLYDLIDKKLKRALPKVKYDKAIKKIDKSAPAPKKLTKTLDFTKPKIAEIKYRIETVKAAESIVSWV